MKWFFLVGILIMLAPIIVGYNTPLMWFFIASFPLGLIIMAIGIFFDRKQNPVPKDYKPSTFLKVVKYFFIGSFSLLLLSFLIAIFSS